MDSSQLAMGSSPCAVPATLLHFTAGKGMEGREGVSSLGVIANPKVGYHKILSSFSLPRLSLQLVFILAETPLGFLRPLLQQQLKALMGVNAALGRTSALLLQMRNGEELCLTPQLLPQPLKHLEHHIHMA